MGFPTIRNQSREPATQLIVGLSAVAGSRVGTSPSRNLHWHHGESPVAKGDAPISIHRPSCRRVKKVFRQSNGSVFLLTGDAASPPGVVESILAYAFQATGALNGCFAILALPRCFKATWASGT